MYSLNLKYGYQYILYEWNICITQFVSMKKYEIYDENVALQKIFS
jgi:hypothetical protein